MGNENTIKDRVKGLERVRADKLVQNKDNFRLHPDEQHDALSGILNEVGFAGAILTRELPEGKYEILDGHLRADISGSEEVPIIVTDLTEEEAKKVLATYDPIGAMAKTDGEKFEKLVDEIDFDNRELSRLVDDLLRENSEDDQGVKVADVGRDSSEIIEEMELKPLEHYDYVVVLAKTRNDWNVLCSLLGIHRVRKSRSKRIGLGRAVEASKLLAILDQKNNSNE